MGMDVTYVHHSFGGWCHCFSVLDVYVRRRAVYILTMAMT